MGSVVMDVSQVIGSAPVAALLVVPKGFGASAARSAVGVDPAGAAFLPLVVRAGARGRQAPPSGVVFDTPRFGGYGLLALTEKEIVLAAGPRNRVHKVIARMPRSEIVFAERYGNGFPTTAPLVVAFKNGHGWYFEVQWNRGRAVKKILPLLKADQQAALQS
jgi:hypothetical protein